MDDLRIEEQMEQLFLEQRDKKILSHQYKVIINEPGFIRFQAIEDESFYIDITPKCMSSYRKVELNKNNSSEKRGGVIMKITVYELLGMVKAGKAPKKIKYKDKIYYYRKGYDFNYMYNSSDYGPMDRDKSLFTFDSYKMKDGRRCWDDNTAIDFLNDEVEIIEGDE